MVTAAMKLKDPCSLEESYDKTKQCIKKQRHHFAGKVCIVKADFSMSYLQMWELDYKESWVLKHWCFQIVVLEKIPESPLDTKAIKPVNPKGN